MERNDGHSVQLVYINSDHLLVIPNRSWWIQTNIVGCCCVQFIVAVFLRRQQNNIHSSWFQVVVIQLFQFPIKRRKMQNNVGNCDWATFHGTRTVERIFTCNKIGVKKKVVSEKLTYMNPLLYTYVHCTHTLLVLHHDEQVCVNVKGLKWKWNCYLCRPKESFNLSCFHAWHEMVRNNFFLLFWFRVCVCVFHVEVESKRKRKKSQQIYYPLYAIQLQQVSFTRLYGLGLWLSFSLSLSCLRSTDRCLLFFAVSNEMA